MEICKYGKLYCKKCSDGVNFVEMTFGQTDKAKWYICPKCKSAYDIGIYKEKRELNENTFILKDTDNLEIGVIRVDFSNGEQILTKLILQQVAAPKYLKFPTCIVRKGVLYEYKQGNLEKRTAKYDRVDDVYEAN